MDFFRNPKMAAAVYASQGDDVPVLEVSSSMEIGEYPGGVNKDVKVLLDIKGDYANITVSKKIKPITPGLSYIINKVFDVEVTRVVKNEQT